MVNRTRFLVIRDYDAMRDDFGNILDGQRADTVCVREVAAAQFGNTPSTTTQRSFKFDVAERGETVAQVSKRLCGQAISPEKFHQTECMAR